MAQVKFLQLSESQKKNAIMKMFEHKENGWPSGLMWDSVDDVSKDISEWGYNPDAHFTFEVIGENVDVKI